MFYKRTNLLPMSDNLINVRPRIERWIGITIVVPAPALNILFGRSDLIAVNINLHVLNISRLLTSRHDHAENAEDCEDETY